MRPRDALQLKADLLQKMRTSPKWVTFTDKMLASMEAQRTINQVHNRLMDFSGGGVALSEIYMGRGLGQRFVDHQVITLGRGETYVVAEHMLPLIRMAAAVFPTDMTLEPEHCPSPDGFLVFEKPWVSTDVRGMSVKVHAITWSTARYGGIEVAEFSDIRDPDDLTLSLRDPEQHPPGTYQAALKALGPLHLHHGYTIRYGSTLDDIASSFDDLILREAAVTGPAVLRTIWHLMSQTLTNVGKPPIPPKVQKGFRRYRMNSDISVITLRREAINPEAVGGVQQVFERNFRWRVRGHWHGYWCGSGLERKLVKKYVHPYFRGPEDAPIRLTRKVHVLTR